MGPYTPRIVAVIVTLGLTVGAFGLLRSEPLTKRSHAEVVYFQTKLNCPRMIAVDGKCFMP